MRFFFGRYEKDILQQLTEANIAINDTEKWNKEFMKLIFMLIKFIYILHLLLHK